MAEKRVKLFSNTFMGFWFMATNFILVILLMWTVGAEYAPEWKEYQHEYYKLFAERTDDPELKAKILSTPLEILQVWNANLNLTDRCMTCHMGVNNPKMTDVPEPHKVHPDFTQHNFNLIGCVVCHEGQGSATTVHAAHVMHDLDERFGPYDAQHIGWERPLLPLEYVEASCQKCHNVMEGPIPGADHLNAGWQLAQEKGCKTCHYIVDSGAKQAPELSYVGTKFFNAEGYSDAYHHVRFGYLKESLRCPQANVDDAAKASCRAELAAASAEAPAAEASLSGEELAKKYQCVSCHNLSAPVKGVGPSLYDIGKRQDEAYIRESILEPDKVIAEGFQGGAMKPMLTGAGLYRDVNANPAILDTLVTYLAGLKGAEASGDAAPAAAAVVMPNFNFSDEDLRNMVVFLLSLQERPVTWPQHPFVEKSADGVVASPGVSYMGKSGEEIVKLAGCASCHKLDGPERLVGPSLWDIGARQNKDYIRASILWPDKELTPGSPAYPKGVMKTTLEGLGFYQQISVEALETLVDHLATLKGKS
jgi:cytochrome c551/c552